MNALDKQMLRRLRLIASTVFKSLHGLDPACLNNIPDSKAHGANLGPIWGRQDPGGPHVGPINLAIWDVHS